MQSSPLLPHPSAFLIPCSQLPLPYAGSGAHRVHPTVNQLNSLREQICTKMQTIFLPGNLTDLQKDPASTETVQRKDYWRGAGYGKARGGKP